jgi:penicillin amidase
MKWLVRGLAVFGAAVAVTAAAGFLWLRTSLPQIDGTIRLAGLTQDIEILRDEHGVPHIFAASEDDAYFALGFVHAQDRLWQMELMRLAGAGRLAEVLGERALRSDRFVRTLGLYRLAEQSVAKMPDALRGTLDAYARGVNAWIDNNPAALPPEFVALRHRPEKWRPADSLVWGRLMALRLGGNWQSEALRARLAVRLTPKQIDDLWPVAASASHADAASPSEVGRLAAALLDSVPPELGPLMASNVWAVSGTRSQSGKPLLANDPHLGFEAPAIWYLARLEAPGLSLAGATTPGVPFMVLGHNDRIAWGLTTTEGDTQDLFVERLDPSDDEKYLTPDGPRPFEKRTETIKVRGRPPVTLTIRATRHGPVVADVDVRADAAAPVKHVLALAAPVLRADDRTPDALWRLNHAHNRADFENAMRRFEAPQQNVAYADVDGTIGMVSAGLVPVRRSGDGMFPAEGWTGAKDWTGFLSYEELPRSFNPSTGVIMNANNKPVTDSNPHFLGKYWYPPYRAERILARIAESPKHAVTDMSDMQMDIVSETARDLLPLMLKAPPADDASRHAIALLSRWHGTMDQARPEPLIFVAWLRSLMRVLAQDELGPLFPQIWDIRPDFIRLVLTRETGWCDNIATPNVESCDDALATSLAEAIGELAQRDGAAIEKWRWGDEHKAHFRHTPFSFVPVLRRIADIVTPIGGGDDTIARAAMPIVGSTPFEAVHGPGLRAVYDLSDLSASRFIVATGQSGNPLSSHYSDMTPLWRDGKTITLAGARERLRAEADGELILAPEKE